MPVGFGFKEVTIAFFLLSILIAANPFQHTFSQDNTPADIIKESQENLQKFEERDTTSVQSPSPKIVQPTVSTAPKADFTNSNFAVVVANPDGYLRGTVDVTGEVSNFPEPGLLQMYVGGDVNTDTVVHYNDTFVFTQEDCVKVTGVVEDQFVGTNMFLATLIVPSISARTIDKVDCSQGLDPAVKTVGLEKTQTKGGIKVTFHKVDFSDKNTRVYLTVENVHQKASISFYDFNAKALQGNKQYSTDYSFIVDYPKIESNIPPGIEETGVILFEPLNHKTQTTARFQFEATRQDTYDTINFVFPVAIPRS